MSDRYFVHCDSTVTTSFYIHVSFFAADPECSYTFPMDYLDRVKTVHEKGGHGSKGWVRVVVLMCELWTSIVYNLLDRFLWKRTLFSCSYSYSWKLEEAQKNLLRTHTTAVSARMLYKLAQQVVFYCHNHDL